MTILILHGVSGKHWMQYAHDECVKLGHKVIMPTLPDSDKPDRNTWLNIITDLVKDVDHSELVIIGHSLGVPAALEYLEGIDRSIKSLISVAGFYEDYGS